MGLVAPDDAGGGATEPSPAAPSPAVPSPVVPSEAIPPELVEPAERDREDRLPVPVVALLVVLEIPKVVGVLGIAEVLGVVAFPAGDEDPVVAEVATVDGAELQASEPDVPDIAADALGVPGIMDA